MVAIVAPAIWGLGVKAVEALAGLALGYGLYKSGEAIHNEMSKADEEAGTKTETGAIDEVCSDCPCKRTIVISRSASPHAAQHMVDAQSAGHPSVLTLDRAGTAARRAAALRGTQTLPNMDRDEYPPATFLEGGAGASVRLIPFSDNRSAGAQMRNQLRGTRDGCIITMTVGP